ncbi:MAG: AraC family transcriptional regulator [Gemmatimonadales bacterium]
MSNRPERVDREPDIVSEVLGAVHLRTDVFGRMELGTPWAIRVPPGGDLTFYVLARGGAWLELEGTGPEVSAPLALSAGDVVLLRHRGGHILRDESRGAHAVHTVGAGDCPRPTGAGPRRLGGDGPATTLVTGAFRFGAAPPNVLLESLPAILHAPAGDPRTSPQLAATAQLILAESAAPGPGSSMLSARLAEILLIHAMRARVASRETGHDRRPGLCALADPATGGAMRLIHARPAGDWTVERLAREVNMSRSAFAARFTELVGVPPLQYVTQWRMTEAARRLRESEDSVAAVAEQVGYANAAAFMKAFTRVHGVGPGTYRRSSRGRPVAAAS